MVLLFVLAGLPLLGLGVLVRRFEDPGEQGTTFGRWWLGLRLWQRLVVMGFTIGVTVALQLVIGKGQILLGLGFIQFGVFGLVFRKPIARLRRALWRGIGLNPSTRYLEIGGLVVPGMAIVAGGIIFATAFV